MRLSLLFFTLIVLFSGTTFSQNEIGRPLLVPYRIGDIWGAADTTGKIIITPKFKNRGYWTGNEKLPSLYTVGIGKKYGVINIKDEFILDTIFKNTKVTPNALLAMKDEKFAIYTLKGKQVLPPIFYYIEAPIIFLRYELVLKNLDSLG